MKDKNATLPASEGRRVRLEGSKLHKEMLVGLISLVTPLCLGALVAKLYF